MLHFPLLPAESRRSLLAGVSRESAHWHVCVESWRQHGLDQPLLTPDVSVEVADRAIRRAVSTAVAQARRIGVLATGGLDSSLVAAVSCAVTGEPPVLVSIAGGLAGPAELRLQAELARQLRAPLERVEAIPPFSLRSLQALNRGSDFPVGGIFSHVWDRAAEHAAEHGIDVLLSGEGGDDLYSLSAASALEHLADHGLRHALASVGFARSPYDVNPLQTLVRSARNAGLPALTQPETHQIVLGWYGPYAAEWKHAAQRRRRQMRALYAAGLTPSAARAAVWLERIDLVTATDSSGRVRIEAPLAYPEVWSAVGRSLGLHAVPAAAGWQDKYALRLLARRYLPASLSEHKKVGMPTQNSVICRTANLRNDEAYLRAGAEWLGLRLDSSFLSGADLPVSVGQQWSRMLAMCVWAHNAL
jgi:asparagine synthetase B (glutamine-hydrolysing)